MKANEERVRKVIMDVLATEDEQVTPGATFEGDLGADSLDCVEIVMGVEEEFNIAISEDEAEKASTVQQLYDLVEAKAKKPAMPANKTKGDDE